MRIALVADTFPPLRSSGAVQLRDLSRELARQGNDLTVFLPSSNQDNAWMLNEVDGVRILRLKSPRLKDVGYIQRTLGELIMPFAMLWNLRKSPLRDEKWDGVVWYSPSIFHGVFVGALKRRSNCKGYLILRDIFPEWALDMGLMSRGLPYFFFKMIAIYQYSKADTVGVQAPGNKHYFKYWERKKRRKIEVLQNWLGAPADVGSPIQVRYTKLSGRKLFVYAGNMGVAQGMDILINLAERLIERVDVGFLFVGRGSDVGRLKALVKGRCLDNVLFFDEIDPDCIPSLYSQCNIGVVALDPRHKSHNIPGKFLTYMQNGLPVLANVNAGNDLVQIVRNNQVGQVCENNDLDDLQVLAETLIDQIATDSDLSLRCLCLFYDNFSVQRAAEQITSALKA